MTDLINDLSIKIKLLLIPIALYFVSCSGNTDKITNYLNENGDFKHSDTCMVDLCYVYGLDFDSILIFDGWEFEEAIVAFVKNRNDLIASERICRGSDYTSKIVFVKNGEIVKTLSDINFNNESSIFSEDRYVDKGGFRDGEYYEFMFRAYIFPSKVLAIREWEDGVLKYILYQSSRFLDILEDTDIIRNVEFDENEIGYKKGVFIKGLGLSKCLDCSNIRKNNKFFESEVTLGFLYNNCTYYFPIEKSAFDDFKTKNYKDVVCDFEADIVFYRVKASNLDTSYCAYINRIECLDSYRINIHPSDSLKINYEFFQSNSDSSKVSYYIRYSDLGLELECMNELGELQESALIFNNKIHYGKAKDLMNDVVLKEKNICDTITATTGTWQATLKINNEIYFNKQISRLNNLPDNVYELLQHLVRHVELEDIEFSIYPPNSLDLKYCIKYMHGGLIISDIRGRHREYIYMLNGRKHLDRATMLAENIISTEDFILRSKVNNSEKWRVVLKINGIRYYEGFVRGVMDLPNDISSLYEHIVANSRFEFTIGDE